tara:strand:- start:392 stop:2593 length:2202 start_codon:yes stop_codon:yes gene_type:complete
MVQMRPTVLIAALAARSAAASEVSTYDSGSAMSDEEWENYYREAGYDSSNFSGFDSYVYGYNYNGWWDNDPYNSSTPTCMLSDSYGNLNQPCADFKDDGECDASCNYEECEWDGADCFHEDDGCYTDADGADYRGNVSTNNAGYECLRWSDERLKLSYKTSFGVSAGPYTYTPGVYPDAGLGGHNYCRNPDHQPTGCEDASGEYAACEHPWCLHWIDEGDSKLGWAYCDVGAPQASCPPRPEKPAYTHAHELAPLAIDAFVAGAVGENKMRYYAAQVPAHLGGLHVVLVPTRGTAHLYADFRVRHPSGHNATYSQTDGGVSQLRMSRQMYGFCGRGEYAADGAASPEDAECTLYVTVAGDEDAEFSLAVFEQRDDGNACAPGCDWSSIGDGDCDPQCNSTACFGERGDCDAGGAAGCHADCSPDWIADGYCDTVCFNLKCSWDGGDCGRKGCADGCLARMIDDGKCDATCNVPSCSHDGADCFFGHHECYTRADGWDYRGTVSHTVSGRECQAWSSNTPHTQYITQQSYPNSGVGGHNYCRNADHSEKSPWCYTTDPQTRYEACDVGAPQESCPPPPPPIQNFVIQMRHWPRSPPMPEPPPSPAPSPPPAPCPSECLELADNGKCDALCNSTVCLWDKGDCGSILAHLLGEVGIDPYSTEGRISRLKMLLSTDLRAQATAVGLVLGMVIAIAFVCFTRWAAHKKRMAGSNESAKNYTPYGMEGGGLEMENVIT